MKFESHVSLPNHWVWTTLQGIGNIYSGGTPSTKNLSNFEGDIPWITPSDLTGYNYKYISRGRRNISREALNSSSAVLIPASSVLFSSRAPIGYVVIAKNEVTTNQGFKSIKPLGGIFSEYIFYYLKSIKDLAEAKASGTTFLEISKSKFESLPFPLAPLPEQYRIVAKIEELFSQLDVAEAALKRAKNNLERYRRSVLQAAVTGELTKEWRDKHADEIKPASDLLARILDNRHDKIKSRTSASFDASNLPKLPNGWVWSTIEQVAEHRLGKMLDKNKNKGDLLPYLRNINVRWFRFDLSDLQQIRVMEHEIEDVSVHCGDIVICEGGEPGRCAVWENSQPIIIQKALHRIRLIKYLLPHYVTYIFAVNSFTGMLERYFTGSTIKHLTGVSLKRLLIPIPPLQEQSIIINEVEKASSVIGMLETHIIHSLLRISRLRQSILQRAFQGCLVEQDPRDEPASVLLQRIQAQREARQKAPTPKEQP